MNGSAQPIIRRAASKTSTIVTVPITKSNGVSSPARCVRSASKIQW